MFRKYLKFSGIFVADFYFPYNRLQALALDPNDMGASRTILGTQAFVPLVRTSVFVSDTNRDTNVEFGDFFFFKETPPCSLLI
jgi:hypothetical protein